MYPFCSSPLLWHDTLKLPQNSVYTLRSTRTVTTHRSRNPTNTQDNIECGPTMRNNGQSQTHTYTYRDMLPTGILYGVSFCGTTLTLSCRITRYTRSISSREKLQPELLPRERTSCYAPATCPEHKNALVHWVHNDKPRDILFLSRALRGYGINVPTSRGFIFSL